MEIQQIIQVKYAGEVSELPLYSNLAVQTIAILIGGIIAWRVSNAIHARKQKQRAERQYFESKYSKAWRGGKRK